MPLGRSNQKAKRPVISEPFGPVKNSRGADLVRSGKLTMVDSIKDCEIPDKTPEKDASSAARTTRAKRLSAGFASSPLVSSPTIASSDIMATPMIDSPATSTQNSFKKPRKSFLSTSSIPKAPSFKALSTASLLSRSGRSVQNENIPPSSRGMVAVNESTIAQVSSNTSGKSKLPKSRTMTALHDLRKSMSRPSFGIRSGNSVNTNEETSSRNVSGTSIKAPTFPSASSRTRLARPSLTSLRDYSDSCYTPEPVLPDQVDKAQSSAYWSGRFTALHDRFSSEILTPEALKSRGNPYSQGQTSSQVKTPYTNIYQKSSHLPFSATTSALRTLSKGSEASNVTEEDAKCRRIFIHLECLCVTPEARLSLQAWQQAYARRHNRPYLLPEGGSMEERGLMAKIFGSSASKMNLGGLRQASSSTRLNRSYAAEESETASGSKLKHLALV